MFKANKVGKKKVESSLNIEFFELTEQLRGHIQDKTGKKNREIQRT